MDDFWSSAGSWFSSVGDWFGDAADWTSNLFSGIDLGSVSSANSPTSSSGSGNSGNTPQQPTSSGPSYGNGSGSIPQPGDDGSDEDYSPNPTPEGAAAGRGLMDQITSAGGKVLDSILSGDSRTTGLVAGLLGGAIQGYQNGKNTDKALSAQIAQSEEAYQRLLKMKAIPAVGNHGAAVDFGVKFKGAGNNGIG